jgi:hypothetical protein
VKSLLEEKGDANGLQPLKGFFNFRSYFWWWVALGVVLLIILGVLLFRWSQSRNSATENIPKAPPRPPEEVAWQKINALEDKDLLTQGMHREFYYQLSDIMREYLEARYKMSALDKTSSELLAEFRRLSMPFNLTNLTRDFLENADLVKFAKFTPSVDDASLDLNRIKELVTITTPAKEPAKTEEKISV